MKIEQKEKDGFYICTPFIRRLDVTNSDTFKTEMAKIIHKGCKFIILNLSKIDFMDSQGLASLISVFKNLAKEGSLGLCAATTNIQDLFTLTRMNRLFDLYNNEEEAIQRELSKKELFDK
ncbi:MAG: hypothetical protein BGO14_06355 [Chlamydiales bacterium 38-26]|nr:STAS domain-containing protein [Chlamydiales bacterium]OJV08507.1 MAG: hypothetical protein BGO14_06355 [Chlamydiales bacterium 38-26]